MSDVDLTIEICGMSGDGTIAAGGLLNSALSIAGFSILAFDSYPAEIRGFGRCVTRSRVGKEEMLALSDKTDILISLDDEQSITRVPFLSRNAIVIFDNRPASFISQDKSIPAHLDPEVDLFGVPFGDLAVEAAGTKRGRNLTALGSLSAILGIPKDSFINTINNKFKAKGDKVIDANLKSFEAGYIYCVNKFKERIEQIDKLGQNGSDVKKELMSGNMAISLGAIDAGVKLYFGYPITPATPIMEYLAKALPEKGGRVVQMEDEISSIGAVLGSFYAGERAMTATSGPGFALMTELITHGVMAEIPSVIIDAQRGGPATGLPTKTEQSDLHAAVFGGPGDSARIVIAPTNVSECYTYTVKSFQLAEKYQTPVIVLTDFFLDNRVENIFKPAAKKEEITDGNIYPDKKEKGEYKRFSLTESGISPRSIPGMEGYVYTATGLEHTERGIPDYSPDNHMKMSEKRHRKIKNALTDLPYPEVFFDEEKINVGVVAWGSTFGPALEAVRNMRKDDICVSAMKITSIYPFHTEPIRQFMCKCKNVLIPELNFEGQLANLIGHLYDKEVIRLNRVTGEPLTANIIFEKVKDIL
jgi:2-oxoglutarate ferredoxin oxidoreductase subunit alpha